MNPFYKEYIDNYLSNLKEGFPIRFEPTGVYINDWSRDFVLTKINMDELSEDYKKKLIKIRLEQ